MGSGDGGHAVHQVRVSHGQSDHLVFTCSLRYWASYGCKRKDVEMLQRFKI
jgi:hypothetical protein